MVTTCRPFPRGFMGMLLHGAFSQIACAFGPCCLLRVIITKMRRPGLCREAFLSRTGCLGLQAFQGRGCSGYLPGVVPQWAVGSFRPVAFFFFVFCSVPSSIQLVTGAKEVLLGTHMQDQPVVTGREAAGRREEVKFMETGLA